MGRRSGIGTHLLVLLPSEGHCLRGGLLPKKQMSAQPQREGPGPRMPHGAHTK